MLDRTGLRRSLARRLAAATVVACAVLPAPGASATTYPAGFEERTIDSGLNVPIAMAWAFDGRMFVAGRAGCVSSHPPGRSDPAP